MTRTANSVLDASALLALLLNEPGAAKVQTYLDAGAAVGSVNLAEVVGFLARAGFSDGEIRRDLATIPVQVLGFDAALAYHAGLLIPLTRSAGLSLGDRACLALADRLSVAAVTADRQWHAIGAALGISVDLIR